jgi:hypothetical protein
MTGFDWSVKMIKPFQLAQSTFVFGSSSSEELYLSLEHPHQRPTQDVLDGKNSSLHQFWPVFVHKMLSLQNALHDIPIVYGWGLGCEKHSWRLKYQVWVVLLKLYLSPTKFHNHIAIEIFICSEQPGFFSLMILHRVNNSVVISKSLSIENVDCKLFLCHSCQKAGFCPLGMLVKNFMRVMTPSLITVTVQVSLTSTLICNTL